MHHGVREYCMFILIYNYLRDKAGKQIIKIEEEFVLVQVLDLYNHLKVTAYSPV